MSRLSRRYPSLSIAFKAATEDLGQHMVIEALITGATVAIGASAGLAVLPLLIGAVIGCAADDLFSATLRVGQALRKVHREQGTNSPSDSSDDAPEADEEGSPSKLSVAFKAATRGLGQHLIVEAAIAGATIAATAASGGAVLPVVIGAVVCSSADDIISSTTRVVRALRGFSQ